MAASWPSGGRSTESAASQLPPRSFRSHRATAERVVACQGVHRQGPADRPRAPVPQDPQDRGRGADRARQAALAPSGQIPGDRPGNVRPHPRAPCRSGGRARRHRGEALAVRLPVLQPSREYATMNPDWQATASRTWPPRPESSSISRPCGTAPPASSSPGVLCDASVLLVHWPEPSADGAAYPGTAGRP